MNFVKLFLAWQGTDSTKYNVFIYTTLFTTTQSLPKKQVLPLVVETAAAGQVLPEGGTCIGFASSASVDVVVPATSVSPFPVPASSSKLSAAAFATSPARLIYLHIEYS